MGGPNIYNTKEVRPIVSSYQLTHFYHDPAKIQGAASMFFPLLRVCD
jgi:hypothetical protein